MSVAAMARALPEAQQTPAASALTRTVHLVAGVTGWVTREISVRRSMRQLAEFDDHMLRDIGIVRADIEGAVRRGHDGPCGAAENFGRVNPAPNLVPPGPDRRR